MPINNLETQIINNPLSYRKILTIPRKINFGLELELDKIDFDQVYKLVKKQIGGNLVIKTDKSLTKGENVEIATPVLQNNRETWIMLKKLGDLLKQLKPNYSNCSFQVNFDGDLLESNAAKRKFLKLYAVYEDIVYRFSKGEDREYRDSLDTYASPIILTLKGLKEMPDEMLLEPFTEQKRYGIALKNKTKNLIEFRTPNATSNPILWQNYITFFYYLLMYSKSPKCSERDLDEYIDLFYKTYLLEYYENEHLEKAKSLANKIFNNSTDKVYFLQQYKGIKR